MTPPLITDVLVFVWAQEKIQVLFLNFCYRLSPISVPTPLLLLYLAAVKFFDAGFHQGAPSDDGSSRLDSVQSPVQEVDEMYNLRKRVLVTGGAGFLGSHLCERLLAAGQDVICVDNFFTGTKSNIDHLLSNPHFEVIRHDITFPLYVEVDEIYNLACPASPIHYQHDPVQTTKTSVLGAINMLGLAKRTGAKILQASTSEIYGNPIVHPQTEQYWGNVNPIGPRSCYDEGKRCAETLFFDYHKQHAVRIKVMRIFNTYGPRMHANDGRVVSNFVVQALAGKPITIYGNGSQSRSFCYVDDLIEGMIRLMNTDDTITGPINIGNPGEFTVRQLAELVVQMTGSPSGIEYRALPQDDPMQRRPDISLAKLLLDWTPEVPLREGLERMIDYFRPLVVKSDAKAREPAGLIPAIMPSEAD